MWSEGEPLRSARLADWLGVSRPTVTIALRRMARDGMARLTRSKEIELTAVGMKAAESIVRRHRIMERWLTDALGLDWVTADEEAARLEHAVSEVVERRAPRLLAYLFDRGLVPGRKLKVVEVDDVGRTLRVRAGDGDVTLSHETAGKLWVVPV